jgi:hypothetical protein
MSKDKKPMDLSPTGDGDPAKPVRTVLPDDIQTLARLQRIVGKLPLGKQLRIVTFLRDSVSDAYDAETTAIMAAHRSEP